VVEDGNTDQWSLAIREHDLCEASIKKFDDYSFLLKGWSVTGVFALVAAAYANEEANRSLLVVACGAALSFWYVDALWKGYQRVPMERVDEISKYLSGMTSSYTPFLLNKEFREKLSGLRPFRRSLEVILTSSVALPHLFLALMTGGLAFQDDIARFVQMLVARILALAG